MFPPTTGHQMPTMVSGGYLQTWVNAGVVLIQQYTKNVLIAKVIVLNKLRDFFSIKEYIGVYINMCC